MSGSTTPVFPFSEIPQPWQVPGAYTEIHPNYSNLGAVAWPARVLIIGQMLNGAGINLGTGTPGQIYNLFRASDAIAWFGQGSQAARMAAAFLANNPFTPVDIVGLSAATGTVNASATIAISGTATASGTLAFRIGGVRATIPVASGTAGDAVVIQAPIGPIPNAGSVDPIGFAAFVNTNVVATETVTFTLISRTSGTAGNEVSIVLNPDPGDATPPGLTVTITPMTGGTGDPVVDPIITAIAATWYTDIILPQNLDDAAFTAALEARYGAMGKLDTQAWECIAGSYSQLLTTAAGRNSRFRSFIGVQNPRSPSWEIAAAYAAQAIFALGNDPARQLRGLPLIGIAPPAAGDRFAQAQRNILLENGVSTYDVMIDGTMVIERAVSENKTNPSTGAADTSWMDVMTAKTLSRIRYDWDTYVNLVYPRNKMAQDGTLAAESDGTIVTPTRMRGTWAARSRFYETQGWLQNTAALAQQAQFAIDASNPNQMDMAAPVQLLGNLMVLADIISFSLN